MYVQTIKKGEDRPGVNIVELDRKVQTLQANKESWARLPVAQKTTLIDQLLQGVLAVSYRQVMRAVEAKGIPSDSSTAGEEWALGPVIIVRYLRLIHKSLEQIEQHGAPQIQPQKVSTRPDGQVVVNVFPTDRFDKLLGKGRADVWMQPELRREELDKSMASFYRQTSPRGEVVLVLGAGNVSSIDPIDIVYKMFVQGAVCLLKPNPVNEYLGPFWEEAFAPIIEKGYVQVAYGGREVGGYLCQHHGIDEIHITGNPRTHDDIVFGTGPEGTDRKISNQPRINKRITSELGNVGPIIIVPGSWSKSDLEFHAENVATQVTNNAGFNCDAARVLVTSSSWSQRDAFLVELRDILRKIPSRRAYYPGSSDTYARVVKNHPEAEILGSNGEGTIPWTLVTGLSPQLEQDICFAQENFCGIIAETSLSATDTANFLRMAVDFCNNTLFGTLNAGIIIDPKTADQLGQSLDQAIADMRYGTVAVNYWPAVNFVLGTTTWGAYPGHSLNDIQSGIGTVHNSLMFDKPQKSVLYGPFRLRPKPGWFATNKTAHKLFPRLVNVEAHHGWSSIPALIWYSLWG